MSLKGEVSYFFLPPFLSPSSCNADVMIGAGVAILDHEVEAACC